MPQRQRVSILITGFSTLVGEGICQILSHSEFDHYLLQASAEGSVESLRAEPSVIAILSVSSGDHALAELALLQQASPATRIVLMADAFDLKQMVAAFKMGARAYLLQKIGALALIDSLRLVTCGEKVIPGALLEHLPDTLMNSRSKPEIPVEIGNLLSQREMDTLRCLVLGYPNKVIASRLDISEPTVKVHVKAILRKFGVQNRTQAAIRAVNQGIAATRRVAGLRRAGFRAAVEFRLIRSAAASRVFIGERTCPISQGHQMQ